MKLKSPVDRCGTEFGGGNGWDGWTGHVGKHLETTAKVRVNHGVSQSTIEDGDEDEDARGEEE
jgi:hypothetical protein